MACCFVFFEHLRSRHVQATASSCAQSNCTQQSEVLRQRCRDLHEEQQELCSMRDKVVATIAHCARATMHDSCMEEVGTAVLDLDNEDDMRIDDDTSSAGFLDEGSEMHVADQQHLLDLSVQLEMENSQLREALVTAAEALMHLAEKSDQLSQHCQEVVEKVTRMSRTAQAWAEQFLPEQTCAAYAKVDLADNSLVELGKKQTLKPLKLWDCSGSQTSSTATPRSEGASESRLASAPQSARSVNAACWCEG
mmetsp:Transcript_158374/g.279502  ORF Transcript_158374/g.279502 Transcript_158374/m.279502 type:complete len:251 (-) Transcript_158374:111-863(-)